MRALTKTELFSVSGGYFRDPSTIYSVHAPIPVVNSSGEITGYIQQQGHGESSPGFPSAAATGPGDEGGIVHDIRWEVIANIAEGAQDLGTAAAAAGGLIIISDGPLPVLDAVGVPLAVSGGVLTLAGVALEGVADFGIWLRDR